MKLAAFLMFFSLLASGNSATCPVFLSDLNAHPEQFQSAYLRVMKLLKESNSKEQMEAILQKMQDRKDPFYLEVSDVTNAQAAEAMRFFASKQDESFKNWALERSAGEKQEVAVTAQKLDVALEHGKMWKVEHKTRDDVYEVTARGNYIFMFRSDDLIRVDARTGAEKILVKSLAKNSFGKSMFDYNEYLKFEVNNLKKRSPSAIVDTRSGELADLPENFQCEGLTRSPDGKSAVFINHSILKWRKIGAKKEIFSHRDGSEVVEFSFLSDDLLVVVLGSNRIEFIGSDGKVNKHQLSGKTFEDESIVWASIVRTEEGKAILARGILDSPWDRRGSSLPEVTNLEFYSLDQNGPIKLKLSGLKANKIVIVRNLEATSNGLLLVQEQELQSLTLANGELTAKTIPLKFKKSLGNLEGVATPDRKHAIIKTPTDVRILDLDTLELSESVAEEDFNHFDLLPGSDIERIVLLSNSTGETVTIKRPR